MKFGDEANPDPVTILSTTAIEATVPATASGTVTISVLTRAGFSTPAP